MKDLAREIERDLQRATANRVLYLEGPTDVDVFCALIGTRRPPDDVVEGVLIRGLEPSRGSGGAAVEARVKMAEQRGFHYVFGVVDGDGRDLAELDALFGGHGPLFAWRGYDIENLLVRAGWPPDFGPMPDWTTIMRGYSAPVALNRIGRALRSALEAHELHRFVVPAGDLPIHDRTTVRETLIRARQALDRDLAAEFDHLADRFEAMTRSEPEAAHAWLDGKWLVKHHVGAVLKIEDYRARWVDHVERAGGLAEVRALWDRLRPGS